jgi:hypothetical protein
MDALDVGANRLGLPLSLLPNPTTVLCLAGFLHAYIPYLYLFLYFLHT